MTITTFKNLGFGCLLTLLFACGGNNQAAVSPTVEAPKPVATDPAATMLEEEKMKKDMVDDIRNDDPATIAAAKMPEPEIEQPVKATPPPPAPKKPVQDATVTRDKPTVKPAPATPAVTPAPPASPAPSTSPAPATAPEPPDAPAAPAIPDHADWNVLLQKHVSASGNVNYAAFKKEEAKLDAYLDELAQSTPKNDWGRKESMAYWINAYNAFTIKRILKDYPLKSITDLNGGDPWKVKWIELDGKNYSLNNIEHDIIRPTYNDARIHFAVNCAAASCPPIPNKAFTAANLNAMLENGARSFINNSAYNQTTGGVKVSKIFDWYGEDFGDLRSYLNKYLKTPIAEGTEIGFKEYDWALNKQ